MTAPNRRSKTFSACQRRRYVLGRCYVKSRCGSRLARSRRSLIAALVGRECVQLVLACVPCVWRQRVRRATLVYGGRAIPTSLSDCLSFRYMYARPSLPCWKDLSFIRDDLRLPRLIHSVTSIQSRDSALRTLATPSNTFPLSHRYWMGVMCSVMISLI